MAYYYEIISDGCRSKDRVAKIWNIECNKDVRNLKEPAFCVTTVKGNSDDKQALLYGAQASSDRYCLHNAEAANGLVRRRTSRTRIEEVVMQTKWYLDMEPRNRDANFKLRRK